ncbi:MAG: SDR family NAD(P)-dependent oxidoreductase [Pseudomonadota bacterium]
MTDLSQRHALITGGGTGIGAACALALAEAGAHVTVTGRRREPLEEIAARSDRIRWMAMDVEDEESVVEGFAEARAVQPVDIVIANAGVAETAPLARMSLDFWRRVQRINADGAFLTFREALKGLGKADWGRLIAVSSIAGQTGFAYGGAYCASKHAMIGLVRAASAEVIKTGITVNALCPGYVRTPIIERSVANIIEKTGISAEEAEATLREANPNGRFVEPEEVAQTALWLCSDGARSVTGQAIQIAGGDV